MDRSRLQTTQQRHPKQIRKADAPKPKPKRVQTRLLGLLLLEADADIVERSARAVHVLMSQSAHVLSQFSDRLGRVLVSIHFPFQELARQPQNRTPMRSKENASSYCILCIVCVNNQTWARGKGISPDFKS